MAWLGKVTLGNFSTDIAGAVTKLSESVKSIERNFDSALGLDEAGSVLGAIVSSSSSSTADRASQQVSTATTTADDVVEAKPPQIDAVPADGNAAPASSQQQEELRAEDATTEQQAGEHVEAVDSSSSSRVATTTMEDAALPAVAGVSEEREIASNAEAGKVCSVDEEVEATAATGGEAPEMDQGEGESMMRLELRNMEKALQAAAKQSQMKADEIARLTQENDLLKCSLEEAKRKTSEVDVDALREEYQLRIGAAERKVYALTKERDMLRREQNRKTDSSILLKEKDEIIKQVMAEGEELSKKQAAQEAQIRKLRGQVRELEEEKQRLMSRLQVEEAKVESSLKDKAATEKVLQETIEKSHADLAAQRDFYTKIVNEAREAEARAETTANSRAKAELERRLREASERETALVQTIEELRQALSRTEQQAALREDGLRKDMEDLEKRCQAAETRYDELVARVPESTRPLLRQIEAMQEASAVRAEAWSGLERALNSRLQEAEAKAAAAQERERGINERLSQTLSRMAVMEAQVSCLKAELAQVSRTLEKERQRASEGRQEYLAAIETAATHEARAQQLTQDIQELKDKHKLAIAEERSRVQALVQELESEQAARKDLEHRLRGVDDEWPAASASSAGSSNRSDDGHTATAAKNKLSLNFDDHQAPSPHLGKVERYDSLMRLKDGEMSSYAARLSELESTRISLAEELVRTTTECEKLRGEVFTLTGLRAEMDALRRRHASALELMGERDEEVEELRADLADVKQMYREQVDLLVGQIERLTGGNVHR